MHPHTNKTTVKLSEPELRDVLMMYDYAEAAAYMIKGGEQFKAVRAAAKPVEALSDPLVREEVKLVDLVWAFDAKDKDKSSLIGGAELLGYSISRLGKKSSFSNMGFYYDPDHESLDSLRQTVQDLKYAHRRENHIIKTASDSYPLFALHLEEISDPNVREKVADADVITVVNRRDNYEGHVFVTKAARECGAKGDKSTASKLKLMAFSFDPKVDSLEEFAAALEEIKGKNWQN